MDKLNYIPLFIDRGEQYKKLQAEILGHAERKIPIQEDQTIISHDEEPILEQQVNSLETPSITTYDRNLIG